MRYRFETKRGIFFIEPTPAGKWEIVLDTFGHDREALGQYTTPEGALDDLVGGHTFGCSAGDTSLLGLPDELADWARVK